MTPGVPFSDEPYRPPEVPRSQRLVGDQDRPANHPTYEERVHFLATVYGFDSGGFEGTVRTVDIQ